MFPQRMLHSPPYLIVAFKTLVSYKPVYLGRLHDAGIMGKPVVLRHIEPHVFIPHFEGFQAPYQRFRLQLMDRRRFASSIVVASILNFHHLRMVVGNLNEHDYVLISRYIDESLAVETVPFNQRVPKNA